ncbi:MAG TPA: pyrroline-5-carboxylate reductase [Clostridiales bacterium]|jgi:pyrroline-5-carboxylate reductase|nr:pyrroline-5-carboxylate reductase [Clostridiales bacterium]
MALYGIIGVGNMGSAILKASVTAFGKNEVIYYDSSKDKCMEIKEELGISAEPDALSVAGKCKYLILAVKPQQMAYLLEEITPSVNQNHIIVSIAAGIGIQSIKSILGSSVRVVRAMPNTPALLLKGFTGICFSSDEYNDEEMEQLDSFFRSFGKYDIFSEGQMNAVTCACGSSPAYVYTFIEALADSVVSLGVPREKAYMLVSQTVLGAAAMVLETGKHPGVLKDQVCSPGGTTIAGIKALEENGFRNAVMKATDACYKRAKELSLN